MFILSGGRWSPKPFRYSGSYKPRNTCLLFLSQETFISIPKSKNPGPFPSSSQGEFVTAGSKAPLLFLKDGGTAIPLLGKLQAQIGGVPLPQHNTHPHGEACPLVPTAPPQKGAEWREKATEERISLRSSRWSPPQPLHGYFQDHTNKQNFKHLSPGTITSALHESASLFL